MDTQNSAVAEIPQIKLAKVGPKREKKRGGGGWLGGRGATSGFSGALGGSGAGAGAFGGAGYLAGLGVLKTALLALLVGAAAAGALTLGGRGGPDVGSAPGKKLFDSKAGSEADASAVVKGDNSIPNSMGYVSGSLDGLTPEERAKKQAEEEAARKAAEDAQKKADEEAAAKEKADASKVAEATPAPAANPGAGMPKLGQGKFGSMSSALGGNHLSGGSGLSGGINRNFGGAAGLGDKFKGQNGQMAAMRNAGKPGTSTAGKRAAGPSKSKGFARRQLDNAFAQSRQATAAGKSETAAENAGAPFDNNPGQGSVIAGPGVGSGGHAGQGDGGGSLNPGNSGGPINNDYACTNAGFYVDSSGQCVQNNNNGGGPKNDAPYQWMVNLAQALLGIMMIFAILCIACKGKAWAEFVSEYASAIIGVLGGIICALGVAIMAMTGDKMMGGIFTLVGGFCAATAMFPQTLALGGNAAVNVAASAAIASALGSLAAAGMSSHQ